MKLKVNVGDRVSEYVEIYNCTMSGIVTYVHPKGRYYTVEFVGVTGLKFRECFTGVRYNYRQQEGSMKERFLEIYNERITRPGADELLSFLEKSDFFTAPASTKYHLSCPGGLVTHSVHVYERLRELYISERCRAVDGPVEITPEEEESIAICGLLHDLCKVFFYVQEKKSRKTGKLQPNGKPEWEDYIGYSIDDKLPYGHGEKSVYIISGYMKLSREEAFAIRFHMGGWNKDEQQNAGKAFEKYPLAVLTHLADMMATYLDENEEAQKTEKTSMN